MCSAGDRREDGILIPIGAESKEHEDGSRTWNFIVTCCWMTRLEAERLDVCALCSSSQPGVWRFQEAWAESHDVYKTMQLSFLKSIVLRCIVARSRRGCHRQVPHGSTGREGRWRKSVFFLPGVNPDCVLQVSSSCADSGSSQVE